MPLAALTVVRWGEELTGAYEAFQIRSSCVGNRQRPVLRTCSTAVNNPPVIACHEGSNERVQQGIDEAREQEQPQEPEGP